jgi:hypothetical protein
MPIAVMATGLVPVSQLWLVLVHRLTHALGQGRILSRMLMMMMMIRATTKGREGG